MATDLLTVGDLMHDADNLIMADEPVGNARPQFKLETTRSLILVDTDGPVGLLTRRRVNELGEEDLERPARDFVEHVPMFPVDMPVTQARAELENVSFDADRIPVVNEEGRLAGVVLRETLMREAETAHADQGVARLRDDRVVEIHAGMEVRGADGDKLGKVDDIVIEGDTVASFTVSHGLLGRNHKRVTAEHITEVDEDKVHLDFGKQEFGFLPDIKDIEDEESRTALTS